jgi:hypothetical protein
MMTIETTGESVDDDGYAGTNEGPVPEITAYVKDGRLCAVGLVLTPEGYVPFAWSSLIDVAEGENPPANGVVGFDSDDPQIRATFDAGAEDMRDQIELQTIRAASESLVRRARIGDQNAMATIRCIAEESEKGSERAQTSRRAIENYIAKYPADSPQLVPGTLVTRELASLPEDDTEAYAAHLTTIAPGAPDVEVATLAIANGPVLTPARLERIAAQFSDDERPTFEVGFNSACRDHEMRALVTACPQDLRRVLFVGHATGRAQALQGARRGKIHLGRLDPILGAELY